MVNLSKSLKESGRRDPGIQLLGDIPHGGAHVEERFHNKMKRLLGDALPNTWPITLTTKNEAGTQEPMTSARG